MDKRMKRLSGLVVVGTLVWWGLAAGSVFADENKADKKIQGSGELSWAENKAELLQLKQSDPKKFRQMMEERRARLRQEMQQLKETEPQKYEEVMARVRQERMERWERMKEEDPERFQKMVERRKKNLQQRLEGLKQTDPERYERLMQEKEKMMESRRTRGEDPQAWHRYLEGDSDGEQVRSRHRQEWEGDLSGTSGTTGGSRAHSATRGTRS
jgi:hypothetical protein